MSQSQNEFGKVRSILWPIHGFELKKLVPMVLLFFLILFNYTVLRDTKDTLVVTAPGGGAEVIPFLKFWAVLPCAVIFMLIYAKLSNKLSKPKLFYTAVLPFLIFFALFATVLYPARDYLHPNALCDTLQNTLPAGASGFIAIIRNWTYSIFYVMAELWGSVALSLLFWGFANDITKVSESKRFYSLFGLFANFSLIISGWLIQWASKIRASLPVGVDPWQVSLNYLMGMVVLSGLIIVGVYWWINRYVLTDPRFYSQDERKKQKKSKPKLSIKESFLYLTRSKYLGCIAILVLCYGIAINLIEVTWKSQLKIQFPDPNAYSTFMGRFSQITGVVTIFMMLFVGGNVIRRFGWGRAALVTPVVLLITGIAFFSFIIFRDNLTGFIASIGTTPLMLAVIFGTAQNIMSKSAKYSLFDPTKEMAYIPLDQEQKVKGKAAVDVVGARLGKSGGALIQQGLILGLGSIAAMTPYVGGILLFIILMWIIAAKSLNKQFLVQTAETAPEDKTVSVKDVEPASKVEAKTEEAPSTT
ncbi:MAG: NTP/NDP exchange transporter [Simkania sp.]|nr:NTP/NDP exchange transporter [Simkania sp.]MCP5490107.1 NTP/NDP exchange transporter [Chlamydiales bacterium]